MKIGIFDSGFGGLLMLKSIAASLPEYDYVYLGDNARAPYGDRSQDCIYEFTKAGVEFLFRQECSLVILACNTASAQALRRLQQEWLGLHYPDRRILGVVIPIVEYVASLPRLDEQTFGTIATRATIASNVYGKELAKRSSTAVKLVQLAAPLLVPLIEEGFQKSTPAKMILRNYLRELKAQRISLLILACTHYSILVQEIRRMFGKKIRVIEPGPIVSTSLKKYLEHHPEIETTLSKKESRVFFTTDISDRISQIANRFWGNPIKLTLAKLE